MRKRRVADALAWDPAARATLNVRQTPRAGDPVSNDADPRPPAFHEWLHGQLKIRRLTQRQLAEKSGIDHSTISRLTRGDRVPSLRTAMMLVRALGIAQDPGWLGQNGERRTPSPAAAVEYALRSDDLLNETEVRKIMNLYLASRFRHSRVATPSYQRPRTATATLDRG
jgi:transcriptional regulator with XRE-family HTH domain